MNMKKTLAGLMASIVAVSAMATLMASAAEYEKDEKNFNTYLGTTVGEEVKVSDASGAFQSSRIRVGVAAAIPATTDVVTAANVGDWAIITVGAAGTGAAVTTANTGVTKELYTATGGAVPTTTVVPLGAMVKVSSVMGTTPLTGVVVDYNGTKYLMLHANVKTLALDITAPIINSTGTVGSATVSGVTPTTENGSSLKVKFSSNKVKDVELDVTRFTANGGAATKQTVKLKGVADDKHELTIVNGLRLNSTNYEDGQLDANIFIGMTNTDSIETVMRFKVAPIQETAFPNGSKAAFASHAAAITANSAVMNSSWKLDVTATVETANTGASNVIITELMRAFAVENVRTVEFGKKDTAGQYLTIYNANSPNVWNIENDPSYNVLGSNYSKNVLIDRPFPGMTRQIAAALAGRMEAQIVLEFVDPNTSNPDLKQSGAIWNESWSYDIFKNSNTSFVGMKVEGPNWTNAVNATSFDYGTFTATFNVADLLPSTVLGNDITADLRDMYLYFRSDVSNFDRLQVKNIKLVLPEETTEDINAGAPTTEETLAPVTEVTDATEVTTAATEATVADTTIVTVADTTAATTKAVSNPGTGNAPIALAVIPVAIAAAVVIAKKRK